VHRISRNRGRPIAQQNDHRVLARCCGPQADCDAFGGGGAVVDIHLAVSDWTIRHAREQDVERVLSLWDAAGSAETVTDTRRGVLGLVDTDPEALLVVDSGAGEIVGSLIAAWDGWRGSFYRLAVHPDQRRQGIATALLREGERRLLARGAARFTAIVTDDDPDAMSFWTAIGYEQQESRARFVRTVAPGHPGH
jgi:ribosomal protein S18 acetylase RimI-like enzyme